MAYSALRATETDFAPMFEHVQQLVDGGSIPNITSALDAYIVPARAALLEDIRVAMGADPNSAADTGIIDDLATKQVGLLRKALAAKQLAMVFQRFNDGEPSRTWTLWRDYLKEYEKLRASLGSLSVDRIGTTTRSIRMGL